MSVRVGESSDHIHGNVSPWANWDFVQVKQCCLGLGAAFGSLTCLASFDICFNILLHLGPPVLSKY